MYSDDELNAAVAAGALSADAAIALRAHVAAARAMPAVDEEHFRLVTGFNDIFVVIACILVLTALTALGNLIAAFGGAVLVAVSSWGLAEFFTRKRRMALPSIVLLGAFVASVLMIIPTAVDGTSASKSAPGSWVWIAACALATLAAWLHWRRFQVPITVAAGTAAVLATLVAGLLTLFPSAADRLTVIAFVAGALVFAVAMRWDSSDLTRQTRRSDAAFWLHVLAAPLLVHPVFTSLGVFEGTTQPWQAAVVLALYIGIGLVSLAIDRRALMVAALAYVMYAMSHVLNLYGVVDLSFALTALAIGATLVLLSAFWHTAREAVLRWLPQPLQAKLPSLR